MDAWLDPLTAALDARTDPVEFFLRDGDAGWDDQRLFAMMDVIERHRLPLDPAVIPQALSPELARSLAARGAEWDARLGLDQHGLAQLELASEPHTAERLSKRLGDPGGGRGSV